MNRLHLVIGGAVVIGMLGGWLGFTVAVEIYKPDEKKIKQIISAEYLREWSSYTNLPTIKPDDCTVERASPDERRTNVYFVGTCRPNVDGELVTFEFELNETGRVERSATWP